MQGNYQFKKSICDTSFLDKFGFTINYKDNVLQWMEHEISLKDPNEVFNSDMFIDLNNKHCK